MNRNVAIVVALLLATGCTESPAPRRETTTARTTPPNPSLPKTAQPVALECAGKGVKAEYVAQTQSMPPTVDVSFRGSRPTSQAAERALRKCIQQVADTKFVTAEVMGTVWYSRSGSEDDAKMVTLPDGSDHLVFQPDGKKVITWKQREGGPASTVEENVAGGYFVETEVNKVLVAPGGTFISLAVVFQKEPTEKHAFEVGVGELKKALAKQAKPVPTTAYVMVGPRNDPAARRQVKGSNGRFISVDFEPKRPDVLTTSAGSVERLK
ncbi:MAG: hypothetical protein A3H96_21620 [Acidobacteria bacterium RIFCSPLOWO2_02_FULL_67_36]|nr:MAG: hypothetical protein A3H96_21620 [Acidobacteria bacterium RIFCSPLOWO2_02_FULL_67_36]